MLVAQSFDSDHETNELRDGFQSPARLFWGEFGARRGIPRIRAALDRHGAKARFFVPAVSALRHPGEQRRLAEDGHEIGLNGWIHEVNSRLDATNEHDLVFRAADTLEEITGTRPGGMRTPSWDYSPNTLAIARELGLVHDRSLFADYDPYEIVVDGVPTGLVELPIEWLRDDAPCFMMNRIGAQRPYTPPEVVLDILVREFESAYAKGRLFLLTMHPRVTGYCSRMFILEDPLERIMGKGDCWIATHADIARHCAREAGLKGAA